MSNTAKYKTVILTGPIHSGSSTVLKEWIKGKDACGFINPTDSGKKLLQDVRTGETIIYERLDTDPGTIKVGPYSLCRDAFLKAKQIFKEAINHPAEWLIIDEIGKLELLEEGHHSILVDALKLWKHNLLIVVRDSLLQEVITKYGIKSPVIITKQQLSEMK